MSQTETYMFGEKNEKEDKVVHTEMAWVNVLIWNKKECRLNLRLGMTWDGELRSSMSTGESHDFHENPEKWLACLSASLVVIDLFRHRSGLKRKHLGYQVNLVKNGYQQMFWEVTVAGAILTTSLIESQLVYKNMGLVQYTW